MAHSMIGGLIASGWPTKNITASDPSEPQRDSLAHRFGVQCFATNDQCIAHADIVILAVKPQIMRRAVESIQSALRRDDPLIISIAAGIRTRDILHWIGREMPFIRAMPNTPALVNCGVSGLLANSLASAAQKRIAETILKAVGEIVWLQSENEIDVVTGISGSGPAYYFKLMEIMINAAQANGLSSDVAKTLVLQTASGAARLASNSGHLPGELRRQVTSPGGTTEAALSTMEEHGMDETITRGINAAIEKSNELAITFGDS